MPHHPKKRAGRQVCGRRDEEEIGFRCDAVRHSVSLIMVTYKLPFNVTLTRAYRNTVLDRIKRDPKFAQALYAEAVNALFEGETEEGLSMLRDLVHAGITFKGLAQETGLGEKALHRMLSRQGNPTTRNLFAVNKAVSAHWGIRPPFKFAA